MKSEHLRQSAEKILFARYMERASRSTTEAVRLRDLKVNPRKWQIELGNVCDRFVDQVFEGLSPKICVSAPPRHGKTEYVGRGLPIHAYLRAKEDFPIIYVTSSDDRAIEVSGQVRSMIEKLYERTGERRFKPSSKWAVQDWQTMGGLSWKGIGWQARTGGIGGRIIVMDDMIGTSQVYRSASTRTSIIRVVQEDLLSRLMWGGGAVQMETRRGTLDTTQWIQDNFASVWENYVWKCLSEDGYLWPEEFGEDWRNRNPHLTDTSPIWLSLYQQEPVEEGGTLIAPDWLQASYPETPSVARALAQRVAIGCDLSNTTKKTSDECAFVVAAKRGAYRDILEVVAGHFSYPQQKQIIKDLSAKWKPDKIIVELAAGGDQIEQELKGDVDKIEGYRPQGDKVTRLTPHLDRFASLQVRLPWRSEPWCLQWRQEHQNFTGVEGRPDNRVDATVYALNGVEASTQINRGAALNALRGLK